VIEAAAVIGVDGSVLFWHVPPGRTSGSIPDSRSLWGVLWEHRERLAGVAHTHPGGGVPAPSWEDLTTFAAVEAGLGRRLSWWIASAGHTVVLRYVGPDKYDYRGPELLDEPPWVVELRRHSGMSVSNWREKDHGAWLDLGDFGLLATGPDGDGWWWQVQDAEGRAVASGAASSDEAARKAVIEEARRRLTAALEALRQA